MRVQSSLMWPSVPFVVRIVSEVYAPECVWCDCSNRVVNKVLAVVCALV